MRVLDTLNGYLILGLLLAAGVLGSMIGYGLVSRGVLPDGLNIVLLSGVTIGLVSGWVLNDSTEWEIGENLEKTND